MRTLLMAGLVAVLLVAVGCTAPKGATVQEKRAYVNDMRQDTLAKLYAERPEMRARLKRVPGYAVFSNVGTNIILVTTGSGFGVVHDNETGKDVYMRMKAGGVGLGVGIKDFRLVFVFNDSYTMNRFVYSGWVFGAEADASAKSGERGKEAGGGSTLGDIEVYQITEAGIALQASVAGTKYRIDDELNER